MRVLVTGFRLARLANEQLIKYIPGMQVPDNTLCLSDNDVKIEAGIFDVQINIVSKDNIREKHDVYLVDDSDEAIVTLLTAKAAKLKEER